MTKTWSRPGKILVAMDLTPQSDVALDRAIALSAQWGARLYVVHVVDEASLPSAAEAARRAKTAEAELERRLRANPGMGGFEWVVLSTVGEPAERIHAKCDRLFVDLLVIGVSEKKTLGQKLLGTTVERVLRQALQPVLIVRTAKSGPYQKIALTTDFSEPSRLALECARGFFPSADTTLVHAFDATLHGILPSDKVTGPLAEKHEQEMAACARDSLETFAAAQGPATGSLKTHCMSGSPQEVLEDLIRGEGIDLTVVGTHGRTGFRRVVLGSVAEQLIGTLPCDVLAVPMPR